ncbi:MAG TPA: cytochrome c oxidase subunit 4 [Solirubrobacteraceae bacterium]|nr:cytochrome c oxidase subunit 4 [Solirubrobacteraceae bacterium]
MTAPDDVTAAPAVGEEVHMPAPSILPLINAAALALAIVSITISWWLVGFAMLVFLATTVRWVRDVRRDIAELPLDHSHH